MIVSLFEQLELMKEGIDSAIIDVYIAFVLRTYV